MKNKLLFIAMVLIFISASASVFAQDRASQFASAVTIDDDQDGYVDAIDIYLSNTIDDGPEGNTDWDALNLANIANDFWIGGDYFLLIEYITTGAIAEDNLFRLHVQTQEELGTGFGENITVGYSYNSTRKIWDQEDPQGWLVSFNQQEISDGASPLLYEMITVDTDEDDFVDQIKVVFSESLNPNFYPRSGVTPNIIFSFSDAVYSQAQFAHNGFETQNHSNDVYVMDIINATALNNGQPTYKYNPYLSRDGFNNDGPYALRDISANANFAVFPGGPVVLDAYSCKDENGTFIKIQMSDAIDPATVQKEDFEVYISGNLVELTDANTIVVSREAVAGIVTIRLPGIPNGLIARNTIALVGLNAIRSVDGGGNVIYSPVDVKDMINPEASVSVNEEVIYEGGLTQTVVVSYNEPMNPATAPAVGFTSTNWGEPTGGIWSTATYANDTYTVSFTHDGSQEEILAEYATVSDTSGATDVAGNSDMGAESATFIIDTRKAIPEITVSEPTIFEGLLTQEVTVVYDEAMDAESTPTITLTGDNWGEQQNIGWSTTTYNNDTFKATFTHNGTEETLEAFAEIAAGSGALDIYGNGDIAGNSGGFTIDTEKPEVTAIERSNSTIFESRLIQTVTVYYSESMDSLSAPEITFTSNHWQPNVVRGGMFGWSTTTNHNDTYTMIFAHDGTEEYVADETATVSNNSGATDLAGNTDIGNSSETFLIDTEQPTPSVAVNVNPVYEGQLVQTVVVTYDESMDPITAPVIEVGGQHWGLQAEGNWSTTIVENDTYTTTFTHDGTEEGIVVGASIAAASGALDAVGNTEKAGNSDPFTVDTDKPSSVIATTVNKIWEGSLTQTVVVVYDESMDTESAPAITLAGDNWGAQTPVGWSTTNVANDTYTATFTHNGTQENILEGVYIQAGSGAVDVAGNAETGSESPGFYIDTKKPSAIDVVAEVDPIFGGSLVQTIVVTYDESMDPETTPEIVLSGGHWGSQTTVGWSTNEMDNDTYTATFTHDGSDQITQCTAAISVGNATDAIGNAETGEQSTDFWIRVGTPEAVVDLAHQTIYEGQLTQIITITYDEAMDPETVPTIDIDGENWGQFVNGQWSTTTLENDTYTVAVTHNGTEEFIRTVNVNVSGATDMSGNPGGQASGIFKLDTQRPTLTIQETVDPIYEGSLTQTIRFIFSEAMDTLSAVNLDSLQGGGENWNEPVLVGWTTTNVTNDTYVITVTHDGTPENDFMSIWASNNCGARDRAGNGCYGAESSGFEIDTRKPEVEYIDFQHEDITTNNYRQGVAVRFSEPMDHNTTPAITFSAGSWNTEPIDGQWVNPQINGNRKHLGDVYVVYFDHNETPEEIDGITATVSDTIKDTAGNTLVVPVVSDTTFAIDTQKPQPTVSVLNDPVDGINGTQIVEVIYPESMVIDDSTDAFIPVIALTGDNWGQQENLGWSTTTLENDTFTARFTHNGTEEEIEEAFATVAEGTAGYDLVGNFATEATSQAFEIDTKRPVATVTSAIQQIYEGNLTQTVTVLFDETMDTETTPQVRVRRPIDRTMDYWNDPVGRGWSTTNVENDTYTVEFTHTAAAEEFNGYIAVVSDSINATDLAGNFTRGDTDAPSWNVDTRKPTSMATETSYETGTIYVNWAAKDANGIKNVKLYARSSEEEFVLAGTDETGDTTGVFMYEIESGTQGDYYFYTVATDNPGNVETDFNPEDPDAHENVDIIATHFIMTTIPENPVVGEYFSIAVDAVNEDDLRDPDYDSVIGFNSNYPAAVTLPGQMQISGGYGIFNNCLATQSMQDLEIYVWDVTNMELYSNSDMITVLPAEVAPPTQAAVYDVPNDQGGRVYIDYMLSVNDPFYMGEGATMPAIDYYVVERFSKSDMEDSTGIWQAVAFVDLYQPSNGNLASVFLNVPGSDTLMHYRMGSVYISGPETRPNLVRNSKETRADVIYAAEATNLITRDAVQSEMVYCGTAAAADNLPAYANIKVYLEGAYQGNGTMSASIDLPLVSPYDGQEIEALPQIEGRQIIDWIWMEVRYLAAGRTVKSANAFVLDDGSVVDVNGSPSLPYYYTTGENYFVVVKHRNHIAAMTSNRYEFSDIRSSLPAIDFTQDIYESGAKEVEESVFALYAGDVDGLDGIGATDKIIWAENYASNLYSAADIDLDGNIGATDKIFWAENYARETSVPEYVDLVASTAVRNNTKQKSEADLRVGPDVEFVISNRETNTYEDGEYFEFDIEAKSSEATKLYTTSLYISYNTEAFGENVVESGKLSVIRTGISADVIDPAGPASETYKYSVDNGDRYSNVFGIGTSWNFDVDSYRNYDYATELEARTTLMHVAIKFADGAQNIDPEIAFNLATPNSQQIYFTTPGSDDYAAYGNINLRSTISCSLVNHNVGIRNNNIVVNWETQDEASNLMGFAVLKNTANTILGAEQASGTPILAGQESANSYTFEDNSDFVDGTTYYYWVSALNSDQTSDTFGPFEVTYNSTDVDDAVKPTFVTELLQNTPNPFNPVTRLNYSLGNESDVTIEVFNVKGQKVKTFNEGTKSVGAHYVTWQGDDNSGKSVGSGVYFYRLQAGNFTQIKKAIMLK